MIRIFTIFSLILFMTINGYAQCNDYASYNAVGVYPTAVELCDQSAANQDVYIVITDDTSVTYGQFSFDGSIDRVEISGITNLPNGVSYTCGTQDCNFYPSNGLIKVCINFNGTVNDPGYGTDNPVFTGEVDYTAQGAGSGTLPGTLPYNFEFTVNTSGTGPCAPTATTDYTSEGLTIFPNPIERSGSLNVSSATQIELIDFLGNTIYSGNVNSSLDLNQFNLQSGVYFVRASSAYGQYTKKFVVK